MKRFHTDNAKKETCKKVSDFFKKQGTVQTQTAPNSSQSNGTVERGFLKMFAAVRAGMKRSGLPLSLWKYACWDAIEKKNFLPFFRGGNLLKSPNAALKEHGIDIGPIVTRGVHSIQAKRPYR